MAGQGAGQWPGGGQESTAQACRECWTGGRTARRGRPWRARVDQWYGRSVRVPVWLTLLVAGMVILFGLYRLKMSMASAADADKARQRRGLFGLPRRTHAIIGVLYLLLGAGLIATSFGWNPLAPLFAPAPEAPADRQSTPLNSSHSQISY